MGDSIQCTRAYAHCQNRHGEVPGYECINGRCYPCQIGSFGNDSMTCNLCPFGTSTSSIGQTECSSSFSFSKVGVQEAYIPFGVNQISVSLWGGGGGGGGDGPFEASYSATAGGGGGFLSCNISVPSSSKIYVVVGTIVFSRKFHGMLLD